MSDTLGADKLMERARSLAGDEHATLTSPVQALALLSYAIHSQLDFRLVSPDAPLQADWLSRDTFKFRYRHDQSSLEFVVSVQDLHPSPRLLVAAAADANDTDSRSSTLDISTRDCFSPSAFPCPVADLSDQKPFAASHRFKDLVTLYRINIIQKLLPGLNKPGYQEVEATAAGPSSSAPRAPLAGTGAYLPDAGGPMGMFPRGGGGGGAGQQPRSPASGGGATGGGSPAPPLPGPIPDDPLRIPGSGGRGGPGGVGGGLPLADIGRRDLDPLGGMGGTFGGPSGFGRLPGIGIGGDDGGGMFMGPDHPLFRERFGPDADLARRGGGGGGGETGGRRWGGDGYLPPIGAPPGARFDPVGPSNGPPGGGIGGPHNSQIGIGSGTGAPGGLQGRGGRGGPRVHPDMEQPGRGNSEWHNSMFG
ncbi:hypothetical protein JCM10908_007038 [Rhodotorula pacifica]|uniref:uncharacterized protein n=1 Tax=Rhodotorula pacifica TaxID=1495444 RepID=UPI0031714848